MPGNGIEAEVDKVAAHGLLQLNAFVPERLRTIHDSNRLEAGRLLAQMACANCHALEKGAPLRSLPDKFHGSTDEDQIAAFIRGPLASGAIAYMPRIALPEHEIEALAAFIAQQNRASGTTAQAAITPKE